MDCYEAGATVLHFHVRNPATGMGSTNFDHYNYLLKRVKEAVPDMIIQVGGSISFAPHTDDAKAKWLDYDTRHMLTELDPKPEYVTVTTGTTLWDIASTFSKRTSRARTWMTPRCLPRGPAWWWIPHLPSTSSTSGVFARTASSPISFPRMSTMGSDRTLYPCRFYMGPLNMALCGYGGGTIDRNPFDLMHFLERCRRDRSTPSGPACEA